MTTITQEQLDAMLDDATAAGEIRPSATFVDALLGSLGITITPAEPPAEMVKLAREIAESVNPNDYERAVAIKAALAVLQHAVNVVKRAENRGLGGGPLHIERAAILTALGAGGRDAG